MRVVKRRLAALIAERPADPLPVVVEARLYVAKGLLPEARNAGRCGQPAGRGRVSRLVTKSAGSGMGQMLGSALSLPGMMNMVRGANAAAGVAAPATIAARRTSCPGRARGSRQHRAGAASGDYCRSRIPADNSAMGPVTEFAKLRTLIAHRNSGSTHGRIYEISAEGHPQLLRQPRGDRPAAGAGAGDRAVPPTAKNGRSTGTVSPCTWASWA